MGDLYRSNKIAGYVPYAGAQGRKGVRTKSTITILVHTISGDFHAAVVGHALEQRGHRVVRWLGEAYPIRASASLLFHDQEQEARLRMGGDCVSSTEVEVVWYRRRRTVSAPDYVDPRDVEFATEELRIAERSHPDAFSCAFWINSRAAAEASDIKANQLRFAQQVGLEIPRTLISNDPSEIRDFLGNGRPCIYKPLGGHVWREDGQLRKTFTAEVDLGHLPEEQWLRATPGIFQDKIAKAYEVRAQFFGASHFALRIDSSSLQNGDLDWRLDQRSINRCEPVELPTLVQEASRQLMARMGLVSGGFDFIVDPDGRWYFMEVNEAGQFLFIESWCKDLPVLDAFCQFIEVADADFRYIPSPTRLALDAVANSAHAHGLISR